MSPLLLVEKHWLHVGALLNVLRQDRLKANPSILDAVTACAAAKKLPPPGWTKTKDSVNGVFSPTSRSLRKGMSSLARSWDTLALM